MARELRQWTPKDLARVVGLDECDIADFEEGKKTPTLEQLEAIGQATGFPPPFFCQPPIQGWPAYEQTTLWLHEQIEQEKQQEALYAFEIGDHVRWKAGPNIAGQVEDRYAEEACQSSFYAVLHKVGRKKKEVLWFSGDELEKDPGQPDTPGKNGGGNRARRRDLP
jgi:transcriptional regulator with XRE-family HTH domain